MGQKCDSLLLSIDGFQGPVRHFPIPHISIRTSQSRQGKRPVFLIGEKPVRVEDFAANILQNNGFTTIRGEDVHFYLSVLSVNFLDSFFLDPFRSYVGSGYQLHLDRLSKQCDSVEATGQITDEHIRTALETLLAYYSTYLEKQSVHKRIAQMLATIPRDFVLRLFRMYRRMGYTTKGAPDLVAFKENDLWFVEVKSEHDSLRPEQYAYIEEFIMSVGPRIAVLRILPT